MSIFQSWDIQKNIYFNLPIYCIKDRVIPTYYEIIENKETVMIIPLLKTKDRLISIGSFNGCSYYDFIYGDITVSQCAKYINFFFGQIQDKEICLDKIREESIVAEVFEKLSEDIDIYINPTPNVNIPINKEYDDYFKKLSKSTRQNIRTSYNRMSKDNIQYKLCVRYGKTRDRKQVNQIIDIYNKRHTKRYGLKISILKDIYLKYLDFSTRCLMKSGKGVLSVLYMNDEIVAFLWGYGQKNDKTIIVPRLSIVDEYAFYSPGILLINETIKHLIEKKEFINLDLSIGDERYKYQMGGVTHYTYNYKIKL